jgi:ABC-type glycerol-3-phosphate transport system permease component
MQTTTNVSQSGLDSLGSGEDDAHSKGRDRWLAHMSELIGSRGQDWHLLTAGGFVSIILPMVVFFSLQRFFVRGILAGSVKG